MKNIIIIFSLIFAFTSCTKLDPNVDGNLVAKTVDEDSSLPNIKLSSTMLHCQTFGNKINPKIFILEGGPGNDFRYLLDLNKNVGGWSLLQNYQVIYHDYRGSGLSKRHPTSELTMANSLKDLEELIDNFAPNQKVILIGHSQGGTYACQYLNKHPDRVKGVVFIEPGPFSSEINKKTPSPTAVNYFAADINQVLWIKQLIGMDNHPKADYLFGLLQANVNLSTSRGQSCPTNYYRAGAAAALAIAFSDGEVSKGTYDFTTNLPNYFKKVLFISSDQSTDLGFDFQQLNQATIFPNYEHKKVIGTGHQGLINCRTDETLNYIKNYVSGL